MLALSIDPVADESLPGYIIRLAAHICHPNAARVATMAGLRQPGSAFSSSGLTRLSELVGVEPAGLEELAYLPLSRTAHHRFLGGSLHREFIDVAHRKACPGCLGEAPRHRAIWDFALSTCCVRHGTRLVGRCPRCRRRLGWTDAGLSGCRCGASLKDSMCESVTGEELNGQSGILAIATGGLLPPMPLILTGCDRGDLVRLVMCLGMLRTGWTRQRRVETLVAQGPDRASEVVVAGLRCLADWPGDLERYFTEERSRSSGRAGRYGARKTLGPFYSWIQMMDPGPIRSALAEVASAFLHADGILGRQAHRSSLVAPDRPAPTRAVGMMDAARRIGARAARVRRLVEAGVLVGDASPGRGIPGVLDPGSVARYVSAQNGGLNLIETARLLGVSRKHTRTLAASGILPSVHAAGTSGLGRWMFEKDVVDTLLADMQAAIVPAISRKTVGLNTAIEAFRRRGADLGGLLAAIRNGRLPVADLDETRDGLMRFRFGSPELHSVCRDMEAAGRHLTVQAAAERLGLKWQVVSHLVAAGLLTSGSDGISLAAISDFRATFVSGAEMARTAKTSPRHLAWLLCARGVRPVVGPGIDGSRQNFYRRDSVYDGKLSVRSLEMADA
jgi:hypothetical protein